MERSRSKEELEKEVFAGLLSIEIGGRSLVSQYKEAKGVARRVPMRRWVAVEWTTSSLERREGEAAKYKESLIMEEEFLPGTIKS